MVNQYPFNYLSEAIRVIRNLSSDRQVRTWCEAMKKAGYLKELSPMMFELA
jgi:hypothetical protein